MYYQEYNKRKQISIIGTISIVLLIFLFLIVVNFIFASLNVQGYVDIFTLFFIFFLGYCHIKKISVSYKYMLISNEFIVQQVTGHKEKVLININLEQVVQFKPVNALNNDVKNKTNNILITTSKNKYFNSWIWNKKNKYFCAYNDNGNIKCFVIKPSDKFIKLINNKLSETKRSYVNLA